MDSVVKAIKNLQFEQVQVDDIIPHTQMKYSRRTAPFPHVLRHFSPLFSTAVLLLVLLTVPACKNQHPTPPPPPKVTVSPAESTENIPNLPDYPYRPSATRAFDLLHTRLEVSFDWERSQMPAEARLRLSPWFYPRNTLELDARGMVIDRVARFDGGTLKDLPYRYDDQKLRIDLDRSYSRQETLEVFVKYTARPELIDSLMPPGAWRDKGLYFINPGGEVADKPRQIWTQGETHGSSAWFPTFEHANERCTQEIYLTVADSFVTLSNGILVNSTDAGAGKRTDYWRMSLPHAPYLFAMAVGKFSVVKDEWRGREVSYYVEPEYEPYARLIFGKTPAMLEYFSNLLGVEYPWEKYSQIVVRDFVSGAMENTSATIHMGALQHDARQHLDNTYEDFISHELFHQWFGDLVTCESWANLTLNEGFATYGEFLWLEHDAGPDEAMRHLLGDRLSYMYEAQRKQVPLIRYYHASADAMFDGHSYQKGGQVLHMLRKVVGDEAFFASLKHYLSRHAYTDVEVHELRLAFEEVVGEDMHWFFNQWFLQGGHPVLRLKRTWRNGQYRLHVTQEQDFDVYPLFRFPVRCEMVLPSGNQEMTLWMETHDTTFVIDAPVEPTCFIFNSDAALLAAIESDNNPESAWLAQLSSGRHYGQISPAMNALTGAPGGDALCTALIEASRKPHFGTRGKAIQTLLAYSGPGLDRVVAAVTERLTDETADVRRTAVGFFSDRFEKVQEIISPAARTQLTAELSRLCGDSSYAVQASALQTLYMYDTLQGRATAGNYLAAPSASLVGTLAKILREEQSPRYLAFVEAQYDTQKKAQGRASVLTNLDVYLGGRSGNERDRGLKLLMRIAESDPAFYPRYVAGKYLAESFADEPEVRTFITRRAQEESVGWMRQFYEKALQGKPEE